MDHFLTGKYNYICIDSNIMFLYYIRWKHTDNKNVLI